MLSKPSNNCTGSARRTKKYICLFVFKNLPQNTLNGLREQKRKGNPCSFLLNGVPSYLYEERIQPQEREFITAQGDYHIPYKHDCTVLQHETTCSCIWGKSILSSLHYTIFHVFSFPFPSNSVEGFFLSNLCFPTPRLMYLNRTPPRNSSF